MRKKPLRVLVADGDRKELSLLRATLMRTEEIGEVLCAQTAEEAKTKLRNCGADVLLMDFQLPDEDGLDLLYDLQELALSPKPHILILTAYDPAQALVRRAYALGADSLLKKPYYGDRLLRRIRDVCETSAADEPELERVIMKTVLGLRKRGNASGEGYLQQALRFVLTTPNSWRMKDVYNDITAREGASYNAVEAALRSAVTRIFRDRTPTLEQLLALTGRQDAVHMTSSEFLYWLAVAIKLQNNW